MHSYGGLVGAEGVPEDLSWSNRESRGLPGGVSHLFFFAASILAEGQSVLDIFGEPPNNNVRPNGLFCLEDLSVIHNDLPKDEANHRNSKMIDQAYGVQKTRHPRILPLCPVDIRRL